jgi:hypothetical protein
LDVAAGRYFVLADPELIQSAGSLTDIGREARVYFEFADFARGDIFFEPDSSWTEPLNRGDLLGDNRRPSAICRLCACHFGRRRP